jgi:hypothetical protein
MASTALRMMVLPETNVDPAPLCLEVGLGRPLSTVVFPLWLPPVPVAIAPEAEEVAFWKRT